MSGMGGAGGGAATMARTDRVTRRQARRSSGVRSRLLMAVI